MSEPIPSADAVSVSAILAGQTLQDRTDMLEDLVNLLVGLMPGIEVKRAMFSRKITSIRAAFGDRAYVLERKGGGSFEARRQQVVRAVVIRNEPIDIDIFIAEFSSAVDSELRRNERGREALASWLRSNA
ncbi:MAG TPA: hypothetical protein VH277_12960 [Gemmatimonadaceae bacterium]|jgi:hypothetical protein|nr:hypothetical protein [Gemmatimonadaceae bacterium]